MSDEQRSPSSGVVWYRYLAAIGLVLALAAVAGYFWANWPSRTWNGFLQALHDHDIERANRYCDQRTVRVTEAGDAQILLHVRNAEERQWVAWPGVPISPRALGRVYELQEPTASELTSGTRRIGEPRSVWYGHLEVQKGKIVFRSDIRTAKF